jgi:hypothetical protein
VHGIDQQPEIGSAHVTDRGHGGRQVAQRQRLGELERGLQAALGRGGGERGELIETAAEIGIQGDHVGPSRAQFRHHVKAGEIIGHGGAGDDDEPFRQGDRHVPFLQRGRHPAAQAGVVEEGEVAVPVRVGGVVRPGARLHRDRVTAQVGRQVHEVHRRVPEHRLVLDAHVVHWSAPYPGTPLVVEASRPPASTLSCIPVM